MSTKSLKYFMRDEAKTEPIVKVPAPETFKDDNGDPIEMEVKMLTAQHINEIHEKYHTRAIATDRKGAPYIGANGTVLFKDERDNARATRHIIVEALQYPNLKDPELMKFFGCVDVTKMPELVFSRAEEYQHVTRMVLGVLGIGGDLTDEEQKRINDQEVEDAKN